MTRISTLFCLLIAAPLAAAPTRVEHDVIFSGKLAGSQVVTIDGSRLAVKYDYKDNGRGPTLEETIELDASGAPVRYEVKGTSTMGASVAESYVRKGDRYAWESVADGKGETDVQGAAVYIPVESSLEPSAIAVRNALAAGGSVPIVGGGTMAVREVARTELAGKPAVLYATTGIMPTPQFLWLSPPPESKLVAFIYPGWVQMVPKGTSVADASALEARQVEAERTMLAAFAKEHTHRVPQPIVLRNARVFDSESGKVGEPSDVYVNNGRITAIMEAGSPPVDAGTEFDAGGRVVLPGLFDMHVHESPWTGPLHLAGGVTSARDMGNNAVQMAALAASNDDGSTLGPRLVLAGFLEGKSDFSANGDFVVSTLDEAKRAVDWYAARGYPQLKIYNSFPKEHLAATVAYAKSRGMRVSGHVPAFLRAEDVVKAGYDEIQHVNQLMLNFFVKPTDDTRTLARFYLVADNAKALDLDSAPVRDFIASLKANDVAIDPTLSVFEDFTFRSGDTHPAMAAIASHLPVSTRRSLRTNSFDVPADKLELYRASYQRMLDFVARAHEAGVEIVAGTDWIPGFVLHRELELLVKAGIPAPEVLRIATRNGARFTRQPDSLGAIAPGRLADLVVVDGDPTKDISAVRKTLLTIKDGRVFYPDEIHRAMGIEPFATSLKPVKTREEKVAAN